MRIIFPYIFIVVGFCCINPDQRQEVISNDPKPDTSIEFSEEPEARVNVNGKTLSERFPVPDGYTRTQADSISFAAYLREIPLKPHGSMVKYHDGREKPNRNVYVAVADLPIGKRDLHQCADAVMRLRAEYLWKNKMYDEIHFNLTNGFRVDYNEWKSGKRVSVKGNTTWWTNSASPSDSYEDFWKYLEFIFTYAGTLSLSRELIPVPVSKMAPGDVFIRGGSPGHAVIVVDQAEKDGKKIFMLAQSYMPAQELQILVNPGNSRLSPWYEADFEGSLDTPEWIFAPEELMRFH